MTVTTEELQRLVDEATGECDIAAFRADTWLNSNAIYLARRVLAAEKMADAAKKAVDEYYLYCDEYVKGMSDLNFYTAAYEATK